MTLPGTQTEAAAVKTAVTAASVMNHVKNNRLEYIGLIILGHLLGLSDRLLAQLNGVCF
jgi:dsRNA-specific ribonuclease